MMTHEYLAQTDPKASVIERVSVQGQAAPFVVDAALVCAMRVILPLRSQRVGIGVREDEHDGAVGDCDPGCRRRG